jgi:hypothetical protein
LGVGETTLLFEFEGLAGFTMAGNVQNSGYLAAQVFRLVKKSDALKARSDAAVSSGFFTRRTT